MVSVVAGAADLTDGQIAKLVATANNGEITAAKSALGHAQKKEVKDFAKMMVNEHQKNDKDLKTWGKAAKVKLEETDQSKSMKEDVTTKVAELNKKKGADFDKAYIDLQVEMHNQVLADLNDKLIPAAKNAELKSFLETTKSHVQTHLEDAQKIQASLSPATP
jgi:putative membrane protein